MHTEVSLKLAMGRMFWSMGIRGLTYSCQLDEAGSQERCVNEAGVSGMMC